MRDLHSTASVQPNEPQPVLSASRESREKLQELLQTWAAWHQNIFLPVSGWMLARIPPCPGRLGKQWERRPRWHERDPFQVRRGPVMVLAPRIPSPPRHAGLRAANLDQWVMDAAAGAGGAWRGRRGRELAASGGGHARATGQKGHRDLLVQRPVRKGVCGARLGRPPPARALPGVWGWGRGSEARVRVWAGRSGTETGPGPGCLPLDARRRRPAHHGRLTPPPACICALWNVRRTRTAASRCTTALRPKCAWSGKSARPRRWARRAGRRPARWRRRRPTRRAASTAAATGTV